MNIRRWVRSPTSSKNAPYPSDRPFVGRRTPCAGACPGATILLRLVTVQPRDLNAMIRRVTPTDAAAYLACVSAVAAERRYLAKIEGFTLDGTRAFLRSVDDGDWPMVVAVSDSLVIGWCDIIPKTNLGYTHVASMGTGVLTPWRHQGIGRNLVESCLTQARATPLERVELCVYSDNSTALHLYESLGFVHEGRKISARKIDGVYQDEILMALRL